jgi:hypothetical protein
MGEMKIFKSGDSVCVQYPEEDGKLGRWDDFYQTRGGITWPCAGTHPGYFCVFGLAENRPTLSGKKPLILLTEDKSDLLGNFFDKLISADKRFFCDRWYADLKSEKSKGFEDALLHHIRERKAAPPRVWDSSEFGSLEMALSTIQQLDRDNALEMKKGTILHNQLAVLGPDSLKGDNPQIYAVEALARVVMSFQVHLFRRNGGGGSGFANWRARRKDQERGGPSSITI